MRRTLPRRLDKTLRSQPLPPTLRTVLADHGNAESAIAKPSSTPNEGSDKTIQGWIKSVRGHKNVVFAEISDGSTPETLQAVFKGKARADGLDAGASVCLQGRLVQSKGAGQARELLVESTKVLGRCDPETYPIQKKSLPPAVLRDMAHLRFRTTMTASVIRVRDALARDWHDWFEAHDFIHIHTPILTSSDCEGAGETFGITTGGGATPSTSTGSNSHMPHIDTDRIASSSSSASTSSSWSSKPNPTTQAEPFFPTPVNLTVSSQLHLEAPTHSLARTYTLSPAFRAEPSLTSRHLSEFYMLEAELAFVSSLDALLDVVEASIRDTLRRLLDDQSSRAVRCRADLARIASSLLGDEVSSTGMSSHFGGDEQKDPLAHLRSVASSPFQRITYSTAIDLLATQHQHTPFAHAPEWGESLSTEHEKYLAGKLGPVFVTHYPASLKPFYMLPSNADASCGGDNEVSQPSSNHAHRPTVACFDLLFPGMGEMAGGSLREHRLQHLESAMDTAGMKKDDYAWYLDLRRFGTVPHGGWGMGWERWICWVTGVNNIRDVVAFPRWKGNCRY